MAEKQMTYELDQNNLILLESNYLKRPNAMRSSFVKINASLRLASQLRKSFIFYKLLFGNEFEAKGENEVQTKGQTQV
jgi:hypothetical protein